jgi:hypothetical protein
MEARLEPNQPDPSRCAGPLSTGGGSTRTVIAWRSLSRRSLLCFVDSAQLRWFVPWVSDMAEREEYSGAHNRLARVSTEA